VRSKENELAEKKEEKEAILHSVRTEKTAHQKMIADLREASRRMLEIIRESSRTDDYEGKGFSQLKGRLIWPSDGRIAIPYGSQKDTQFDMPVFRNGIHIQTDASADARSVYAGKVIFAEWFKGFGQLIIINHGGGYHSLYGNLSEIFSKVGDIIKESHVIGRVGTSGILNAPGIYFEIRYKGKPLDPMQWLKKKKR
jgi:septal ring factor EnvC (AmiA/AmiB activator)